MQKPDRITRAFRTLFICGIILLFLLPQTAAAQTGHPTGARGGILIPSAITLQRGALSVGAYGTLSRQGNLNTGLGLGSVGFGLTDNIQLYASFSSFLTDTGDNILAFGSATLGYESGPIGLTIRWPGPADRAFHIAANAAVTPGIHKEALSGHNHPYARDSFDVTLSLSQSLTIGSFDLRAVEGIVVTEEGTGGINIPTHAMLGGGLSWWVMPNAGLEFELLSRLETETPVEIMRDYLAASLGAVVTLMPRLNLRGGYMLGLSQDRTDGIGTRAEDWMAYASVEFILGNLVERPGRQPRPRRERPGVRPGVTDSDGDGVPDSIDEEPLTPHGAVVDSVGRALDTDSDGIPDGLDSEADTPAGALVDAQGRAVDSDGDGVPDGIDAEADTPQGAVVDSAGRAVDSDGDGIPDGIDAEPNTPQGIPVDAQGRGLYGMEAELITKGLLTLNAIYFRYNSADIRPESFQTMQEVGLILAKYSELKIEVGGHTDGVGSDVYNLELSRARAQSVLNWILENIPDLGLSQFTVLGYGESQPVASNDTEDGRTLNRRVEFKVLNPAELDKYRRSPL
jgi:outer membrane protein OmpA-like peptidoglycan-associated protein